MRIHQILILAFALSACATTPKAPLSPEAAAGNIVRALDVGDASGAAKLFADLSSDEDKDRAYPILFTAAEDRFESGQEEHSANILRFMSPRYPAAASVRLARLYALFLMRASAPEVESEFVEEMANVLDDVRALNPSPPIWASLIEAQVSIDQGRYEDARAHFARFRKRWNGVPTRLSLYVADLERFLATH